MLLRRIIRPKLGYEIGSRADNANGENSMLARVTTSMSRGILWK